MKNKKWYAVQETSADAWDNGSFDLYEAKKMLEQVLAEKGRGLIAVIVDDYCEEELPWDEVFEDESYLSTEALAGIVREADAWDRRHIEECMVELCRRADVEAYSDDYESWEDPARLVQKELDVDLGV